MNLDEDIANPDISIDDILEKVRRFQTHEINKTRYVHGEYHHLFPQLKLHPEKFKKYARMDVNTFEYILFQIEDKLEKNWCNLHQPIYPEQQLVLTLRFLATGNTYNALGTTFRMGESTVCTTVKNVMNVLWDVLQPIHMPVPDQTHLRKISNDFFKRWNFPHCLGAIDCRHMRIIKPDNSKSLYYNWKGFHSIKLQAVVDANYKFIFIEVGDYGSTHDSTTLTRSKLYECLKSGKFKLLEDDELPESGIILPYYFIGDGAYMLQEHLMKPFRGQDLPIDQKTFNKRLSRARMVVECAFGHLVQTWRIFLTTMGQKPETASLITKCACLLRNVIIDMAETTKNNKNDNSTNEEALRAQLVCSAKELIEGKSFDQEFIVGFGKQVRDELTKYFKEHPI